MVEINSLKFLFILLFTQFYFPSKKITRRLD